MNVARFLASRFAGLIVVLWVLVTIVFLLQTVVPGDPARVAAGPGANAAAVTAKRKELGLDKPALQRYVNYVGRVLRGDLSISNATERPVREDLGHALPASLELLLAATVIAVVVGVLVGLISAVPRRGTTPIRLLLMAGASIPSFLLALLFLLYLYSRWGLFPAGGRLSENLQAPSGPTNLYVIDGILHLQPRVVVDALWHLVLPATTLGLAPTLLNARTLRSSLRHVLRQDYIRTARAKGLNNSQVVLRHGLRNALNAPLTLVGLEIGAMLAGIAVVETIFSWPGIGLYTERAILSNDFPAISGVTLVVGAIYVVANAIVDVLQAIVDPRMRAWA